MCHPRDVPWLVTALRRLPAKAVVHVAAPRTDEALKAVRAVGVVRSVRSRYLSKPTLRALRALAAGNPRAAFRWAEAATHSSPSNLLAHAVRARAAARTGSLSAELASIGVLRRHRDTGLLRTRERMVSGRLRDSDPEWLPDVGRPTPLANMSTAGVMHLHKAALPESQNGYTVRSRYVVTSQQAVGFDPFIVTVPGFPPGETATPEPIEIAGIRHYRLPRSGPLRVPFDVQVQETATAAAVVLERERPAIIHAASGFRGYDLAVPALALGRRYSIPVVYEMRGFFEEVWTAQPVLARAAEQTVRRFAREQQVMLAADAVITIAEVMRGDLIARGISAERVSVVPNAIDETVFQPADPDPDLRARHGLAGRSVLGYVSTLDNPREGIDVLIRATAELIRDGRPVACLIVGGGRLRPELEALAASLGIADSIVFTGSVPHAHVAGYYALIDVFVVPRQADRAAVFTTPLKPYEAMAMARPILVSDLPALVEIALPGERGLSFRAGDAHALAAAAKILIDRPELRTALGSAGRDWVLRERTWGANGRRYRELFDDVLAARAARASRPTAATRAAPAPKPAATSRAGS